MQGNNINTVYVNTWRFYAGSYPYNANGEQDRTKIGVKGSVWLYGKDSNGNSFELDPSRRNSYNDFDDPDLYSINISKAVVTSITRRTNLATGEPMPDTWNNGKGYIYITAKNSDNESLYDTSIEVTTDSAIYQAGLAAGGGGGSITSISPRMWSSSNTDNIPSNYHVDLDSSNYVSYYTSGTTRRLRGLININVSWNNNPIPAYIEMDATAAYNAGRNSYTSVSKEFNSNGTYTSGTNERWNSVYVNVPVRTAIIKWTDDNGNNLSYSNDNDSIRYDSNDHSSLVYYTLTYSDGSKRTSNFWVNTYKAYEAGLNAGSSGIDINDVRLSITQASNASDSYDIAVTMTSGSLIYDSNNDNLIGYVNAFLDTGANTEQDSRRVKITMSASKKTTSGSSSPDISIFTPDNSNNPNSSSSTSKYFTIKVNNDTSNYIRIYKDSNTIKWESTKGSPSSGILFTSDSSTLSITGVSKASYSTTADFTVSDLGYDYVRYDSTNDKIKGRISVTSGNDTKTIFIQMDASRVPRTSSGTWSYNVIPIGELSEGDSYNPETLDFGSEVSYNSSGFLSGEVLISHGSAKKRYYIHMNTDSVPTSGSSTPSSITYSITPATGNQWSDSIRRFNFEVNGEQAGYVQFYIYNGTIRYSYQDNSSGNGESGYWLTLENGDSPQNEGDTAYAEQLGYQAGLNWAYGDDFDAAWQAAYDLALQNGYSNATAMANAYRAGYIRGYNT